MNAMYYYYYRTKGVESKRAPAYSVHPTTTDFNLHATNGLGCKMGSPPSQPPIAGCLRHQDIGAGLSEGTTTTCRKGHAIIADTRQLGARTSSTPCLILSQSVSSAEILRYVDGEYLVFCSQLKPASVCSLLLVDPETTRCKLQHTTARTDVPYTP
ncbi:uncharacterized protein L3040_004713 [Drepanopeziza brunnea f. sp. 'multigermtubi']|uniref:uncharacterized protein n=1 Tax=Drepanopeziza brunnea f. sp. 'multigermtubi' TaxID=698441 RepID=UPI0023928F14|nr:hypothetical protein L3040_004713 [Drepanopeziza brunnea f. sp. 'multigermtubi']